MYTGILDYVKYNMHFKCYLLDRCNLMRNSEKTPLKTDWGWKYWTRPSLNYSF